MIRPSFPSPAPVAAIFLALGCCLAHARQPAPPPQSSPAASLNDALLAQATALYDSAVKTGLRGFDCQVHPDWKQIIVSAHNGTPQDADADRQALLDAVKITLHVRLKGAVTVDWQPPPEAPLPRTQTMVDMLDRAHRSTESTLQGVFQLWVPLIDGSLAESLGQPGVEIQQTASGYHVQSQNLPTAKSKDKSPPAPAQTVTEDFDPKLLLTRYTLAQAGSIATLTPAFEPGPRGLRISSFDALLQLAGAPASDARQMHIAFTYQAVSGNQIPSTLTITLPGVVLMNFSLTGCTVNP